MKQQFSASMCVYGKDNPDWFREAVDSVLNQTVKPDEIVLVVDGEVPPKLDNEIIKCEENNLFNVIRLPENRGHGIARRTGLDNCKYELVALMDADDICVFDRFEKQLNVFENNPQLSIVGGNISEFIECVDNVVGYRKVPSDQVEIDAYIKKRCPFNQMTVMFKRSDVQKVGGYKDWFCNEDYYLWIRMYLAGMRFSNIPEVLVNVRVGKDMYKRRGGWKYFKSEAKLQKYMLSNKVIGFGTYVVNVSQRFVLQVMMPNSLRGYIFKKFARTKEQ